MPFILQNRHLPTATTAGSIAMVIDATVRGRTFHAVWGAQTISSIGSEFSLIALPLVAVVALKAGPLEVGLIAAAETLPYLVVSLPAGVIADRAERRQLMVVADVGRGIALASIPVAFWLGAMSLAWLVLVGLVVGALSALFTVAQQAYLPGVLEGDELMMANQRVEISESGARIAGPALAGETVRLVGAVGAIVVDALSYFASALLLVFARRSTPTPLVGGTGMDLRTEASEGLRLAWGDRVLRDLMVSTALFNLGSGIVLAQVVLFATRDLNIAPAIFGLVYGLGNVGFLLGALAIGTVERMLGTGRLLVVTAAGGAVAVLLIGGAGLGLGVVGLVAGRFIGAVTSPMANVAMLTLRQRRTPRVLHGRVAATFRFVEWGTAPIGAILSGLLGTWLSLTGAMLIAGVFASIAAIVIAVGPARAVTLHPGAQPVLPATAA